MAATIVTDLKCYLNQLVEVQYLKGNLFSLDHAANTFNVYLYDDRGEPAYPGGEVLAQVIRSDGVTVDVTGAITENKAYVIFPQNVYAVPGPIVITIKLIDNENVVTIACVIVNVRQSSTDDDDPGEISDTVAELIALINTARGTLPPEYTNLLDDIAAPYSPSSVYPTVGTMVWQEGDLKKNIVPILTAETFDPTHWESARACTQTTNAALHARQLTDDLQVITGTVPIIFERGYYYPTLDTGNTINRGSSSLYAAALVPVNPGDEITINATGATGNYRLYVWIGEDGKSVGRSTTSLSGVRKIIAPANAVYCAINNRLGTQPSGYYAYKNRSIIDRYNDVVEEIQGGYITPIDRTVVGLTAVSDGNAITLYGTAEAARRWVFFNGLDSVRTTSATFIKTFDPGTYTFDIVASGTKTTFTIVGTYTTFTNEFVIAVSDTPHKTITFTQPAMVALTVPNAANYGTEENPTVYTITVTKPSAIDHVARTTEAETEETVSHFVDNEKYNSFDLLAPVAAHTDGASSNVTYTWDETGTVCHAVGTASSVSYNRIYGGSSIMLPGIIPGNTYYVSCETTDVNLLLEIWLYFDGSTSNPRNNMFVGSGELVVPSNTTGMTIRVRARDNTTVDAYISNILIKNALSNEELSSIVYGLFSASGVSF